MSEQDTNNTTAAADVATAVAATNDDVSSSLASALSLDTGSSSVVSGGSLSSAGSSSAVGSAGSTGSTSLASAYKTAVLSSLNQTYYAGSLDGQSVQGAALAVGTVSIVSGGTLDLVISAPSYSTASTFTNVSGSGALVNAAASGYANIYNAGSSVSVGAGKTLQVGVASDTVNQGHAIYNTISSLSVATGGQIQVASGNALVVGANGSAGGSGADLKLLYSEGNGTTPQKYALQLDSAAFLSATGLLGGVANKGNVGQAANSSGARTGAVSAGNNVSVKVDGDWGTVGDYRAALQPPVAKLGDNNKVLLGGTYGVFMNASALAGSNLSMEVATSVGSGFFIGSGALFSAGANGRYHVMGGMGAAYSGGETQSKGRLFLGSNTSVVLDQANFGNFAAQAGGYVSAADGFYLRALALSIGYGQDPNSGSILGAALNNVGASMTIGNDATIILAQSGLKTTSYNIYIGSDGAITADASNTFLTIGTGATISARTISIGNYAKDYSGTNPQTSSAMNYAYFTAGSNNNITIGSGATINLSGGIALDGNANSLTLTGGGTSGNILNAGSISAGNFYKPYQVGQTYSYAQTVGTNLQIGDGYSITLTSGVVSTGLSSYPANISNDGNFEVNQVSGSFTVGNNVTLNANSVVLGDYYLSTVNPFNSTASYTLYAATSGAKITYGNNANLNLSGSVLLNGYSNTMAFGSALTLTAKTMSMGIGSAGTAPVSNIFSAGNNANITLTSGLTNNLSLGSFTLGDNGKLTLLSGNLTLGSPGASNSFLLGSNNSVIVSTGSVVIANSGQILRFGSNGTLSAAGGLYLSGYTQSVYMSNGANVNVNSIGIVASNTSVVIRNSASIAVGSGGVYVGGISAALSVGDSAALTIGSGGLNIASNFGSVTVGSSASIAVGDKGITVSADNASLKVGTNASMTVGDGGLIISGNSANASVGANASVTIGKAGVSISGGSANFSVGALTSMTIGSGGLTIVGNSANTNIGSNASVNIGSAGVSIYGYSAALSVGDSTILSVGNGGIKATSDYTSVIFGNKTSVNIGNGGLTVSGYLGSVTVGNGASVNVGNSGLILSGNYTNASIGSNAIVSIGSAGVSIGGVNANLRVGDSTALTIGDGGLNVNSSATSVIIGSKASVTIGKNGVNLNDTYANFSVGDSTVLSVGDGGFNVKSIYATISIGNNAAVNIGSGGLNISQYGTFTVGSNGSMAVNGDINFGSGASAVFTVGANTTLFKANNINLNAPSQPTLSFGSAVNFNVSAWNINSAGYVSFGDGATGSLGNIIVGSSAANVNFNTGSANGATFGSATLTNNTSLTLNGKLTGSSLNISGSATVIIPNSANVNVSALTMDGTGQVTISVGQGATLSVATLATNNVGTSNMPRIAVAGGNVVIGGVPVNTTSLSVNTDFVGNGTGIVQYKGTIQEASGHLTITSFSLTNEAIFKVSSAYADQSRYITSYTNGQLIVKYVNTDGTVSQLASFAYNSPSTGTPPNVLITTDATDASAYDLIITKCFLTGTHILTPEGEVTVENIQEGDQVIALEDGQQVSKRVVWAGNMDVNVNHYEHKDSLYPVRIKAHAFGLNQPCRDLLVTPEHTVYVDGGLVPARMLVNGRSIIVDKTVDQFTVYHIETETHSILLSENLTTESYLNTDNRHLFNGDVVNLHLTFDENADHQSWENDAAAPLTVARHQVEPIWQRLDRRATQQGYAIVSKTEITRDPALCLITQKGEKLQPVDVKGNTYSFYVPANVRVVAMHSRAALPSEVVGPFLDDRRVLGVLVNKISVFGNKTFDVVPADMSGLSGWHPAELNRTDRWTKGLATLPEAISEVSNQVKLIKIELTATSEYFVEEIGIAEKIA